MSSSLETPHAQGISLPKNLSAPSPPQSFFSSLYGLALSLHRAKQGALLVEYTVLIGTIALVCTGGFFAFGVAFCAQFEGVVEFLLLP